MKVEFWFDFASTYSYPAAMTIADRAAAKGVEVRWRPFLLGPIFGAQGWQDSPFNLSPAKGRYMWQDMARICAVNGLAFCRPAVFPQHSILAARVALVGLRDGWGEDYCRAVFHAQFAKGWDIADPTMLTAAIEKSGGRPGALDDAASPTIKQALRDAVDEAIAKDLFGAPSLVAGDTLFWGFDRLDDALDHAARAAS